MFVKRFIIFNYRIDVKLVKFFVSIFILFYIFYVLAAGFLVGKLLSPSTVKSQTSSEYLTSHKTKFMYY